MSCPDFTKTVSEEKLRCYSCLADDKCTDISVKDGKACDAFCKNDAKGLSSVDKINVPELKPIFKKLLELNNDPEFDITKLELENNMSNMQTKIFNLLKNFYENNTLTTIDKYRERESSTSEHKQVVKQLNEKKDIVESLKALNETTKREIEISMYKTNKLKDTNKVLMIVLIVVGVLIVFPLLSKLGVLPMTLGIGIWILALVGLLGFMTYKLYFTEMNRDQLEYAKYNFNKPTDEEIAKSRAIAQMSDKDKARCQAFSELEDELDIPNIELDIGQYQSKVPTNKCDKL